MVEVTLVPEKQDRIVGWEFELGQLLQVVGGFLEACLITDGVHHDKRVAPAKVLVEAASFLEVEKSAC